MSQIVYVAQIFVNSVAHGLKKIIVRQYLTTWPIHEFIYRISTWNLNITVVTTCQRHNRPFLAVVFVTTVYTEMTKLLSY
jgi:hypothetical protein